MASPGFLSALQQGMPIETYYDNIRNFIANAPNASPQELVAAAQEWGISGEDIMNATGEMPLSTYSPDSNPMNPALAQALESIPTTINTGVQFNQQTRDVDQGVAAQSDFSVVNPRTGQLENVEQASNFIPGAPANQFVVSSGQGVFEQDGKSYQPVNLVTVDAQGNVSPSGTFNIEKNELSDFANVVGTGTKLAATALSAYAIGSSLLEAAGLSNSAAGTMELGGGFTDGGALSSVVPGGIGAGTAAGTGSAVTSSIPEVVITGTKVAGNSLLPAAAVGGTILGTANLLSGTNLPGQGLQVDPNAGLGDGATVNQSPTGGVSGGTGLDPNLIGAGAGVGGVLGSTGLLTGNNVVDLATGALGAAGNVGGALSLNALSSLFPTGLGNLTQLLSGTNLSNALTSQANTAAASNAASTAAKLGAAAPLINALVSGGLTQNEINNLKSLGAQAQKDYRTLAEEATKDVSFTPYGVTTGLFGTTVDPTTKQIKSTYEPGVFEVVNAAGRSALGSFEQAAEADLNQLATDRMALYQQLVSPEQQRSRLAQEARLQAQGRLGVGAGGGEYAPELRALEDAIAKQNLQFALAAPQEALAQRGALITQGQAASQVPIQLQQQQLAQLQLGGQLGQQAAQTAYQRGGLLGQYAGQGISENLLARLGAAQVASEQNKAIGTALGGLFV